MLICGWCGRPEGEEPIEPMVVGREPLMLCAECRGETPEDVAMAESLRIAAEEIQRAQEGRD